MVKVLNNEASIVSSLLRELRDVERQKDRARFNQSLQKLGSILGYELSKLLDYADHQTTTPLGAANTPMLKDRLVLATILRAGLPVHQGLQQVFDNAELCFIAAGRKAESSAGVEIELTYVATPSIQDKTLVIADTMLATGHSIVDAYDELVAGWGKPAKVFVVSVIASQPGVDYVTEHIPHVQIVSCALDPELNDKFFIVPGLGDAGDLLYGTKTPRA